MEKFCSQSFITELKHSNNAFNRKLDYLRRIPISKQVDNIHSKPPRDGSLEKHRKEHKGYMGQDERA